VCDAVVVKLSADDVAVQVVQKNLGSEYQWSMDDLFPLFQFVVVRSCIQHLAAEIHFTDDLMEPHLQHGESGIMFTTLKVCNRFCRWLWLCFYLKT